MKTQISGFSSKGIRYGVSVLLLLLTGCDSLPFGMLEHEEPHQEELAAEMLEMVNRLRAVGRTCGDTYYPPATPLIWNGVVERAAMKHSDDMADHEHYSHTGTDGSDGGERLGDVGYPWQAWGENIAKGYKSTVRVVDAWVKSPGHCKNLMNEKFTEMGAAVEDGYWTQLFAHPWSF